MVTQPREVKILCLFLMAERLFFMIISTFAVSCVCSFCFNVVISLWNEGELVWKIYIDRDLKVCSLGRAVKVIFYGIKINVIYTLLKHHHNNHHLRMTLPSNEHLLPPIFAFPLATEWRVKPKNYIIMLIIIFSRSHFCFLFPYVGDITVGALN